MRKRWSWLVVMGIAALVAALAALGGGNALMNKLIALHGGGGLPVPRPGSIPSGRAAEVTIPFSLVSKHVLVDVAVGGRPLSFILDTGDRFAVIDRARAAEMGLALGHEVSVVGVGAKTIAGAFVRDSEFSLPGFPGFSQPLTIAIPLKSL